MNTPVPLEEYPAETLIPLTAITQSRDPHRAYDQLRLQYGPVAPVEVEPGVRAWLVTGAEHLRLVAEREVFFSRDARHWRDFDDGVAPPGPGLLTLTGHRPDVTGADQVEHRRLRRPLDDAMGGIDHRALRRQVQGICSELIVGFSGRGTADLVAEYAALVPVAALAGLLGLDADRGRELRAALNSPAGGPDEAQTDDPDAGDAQAAAPDAEEAQTDGPAAEKILSELLQERRQHPATDLTTALANHPELQGDPEVLQSMGVLVSTGNETTTCWIAHALIRMLADASSVGPPRRFRLDVDDALDEVLWREPPVTHVPARYALRDVSLGGRPVRRGDALVLGLSAANADPVLAPAGRRPAGNRAHTAFSAGPHMCPAQDTARVIARTAVESVLHLLPGLRLTVAADELTWNPSPWTRRPTRLPVEFAVPHGLVTTPDRLRTVGDPA